MKNTARLIILLLVVSTSLFAGAADDSNYVTDFGIYVYGNIQSIENAFIMVQAVAQSDAMPYIIGLITVFYIPYTAYEYFSSGSGKTLAVNLTFMTASILFLDTTHLGTTVHIEDLRAETNYAGLPAKTYAQVDGIPYPIAFLASSVSTIVDSIKTVYEDAIQVINVNNGLDIEGASYGNVGFANSIGDILKLSREATFNTGDANTTLFGRATQAYISDCVLKQAVTINPNLVQNVKNPSNDIFKAIDPSVLGIEGDAYTLEFDKGDGDGTQTYQCDDFYNDEISDKYSDVADKLLDKLNHDTVSDLTIDHVYTAQSAMGADVNDSFIASDIGKFKAYAMNVAATGPVINAFRNIGTDISSGQDVANSITAASSLADLQNEGAGRFKWMAEMLPLGFHYMLGVIYSISILIMIVATALGTQKGMMIWKNFAKGLMTFEFIKVALVIINSSVNQYASMHAADLLASIGQNPATVTSLPYYLHYMATMAGIAGLLGISAVFMIPAMVFSGEVGMAAGALSSLASKYKGNDIQTSTQESAKQKATNEAYEKELRDRALLDNMGISVPEGMGASDYYAEYKRGAEQANVGFGAGAMGTSKIDSAAHALKGQTMQNISAMSTLDGAASMQDFVSAGVGQGAMMAKSVGSNIGYGKKVSASSAMEYGELSGEAMGEMDIGTYEGAMIGGKENYLKGTEHQAAKRASSTASYGKETSLKDSVDAGKFEGTMSGAKDKTLAGGTNLEGDARTLGNDSSLKTIKGAEGLQDAKIYNKDGSLNTLSKDAVTGQLESDKYLQGLENQSRIGANKIQGVGRLGELTEEQMTNVQRVAQAGALAEFAKGDVLKEKYGANLDSKNGGYSHVSHNNASMQEDKAIGASNALDSGKINSKMLQDNTQYGIESSNVSTAERLKKLHGIDKAVELDKVDSAIKASTQRDVINGQLKEGGASGLDEKSADKIAAAIEKIASTAGTKSRAELGKDMKTIKSLNQFNKDNGGYIGAMRDKGVMDAIATMGTIEKGEMWTHTRAEQLDGEFMKEIKAGRFKKGDLKDFYKNGDVESGNIKEGYNLAEAVTKHAAGNIQGMHGIVIGGKSVGLAVSENGMRITGVDSSSTNKSGQKNDHITTNGSQQRIEKSAKEQLKKELGREPTEQEVSDRADEMNRDFEISKSKASLTDDVALAAGETITKKRHEKQQPLNKNNKNDDGVWDSVKNGAADVWDYAKEHSPEGLAAVTALGVGKVINKGIGDPAGKITNKAKEIWGKKKSTSQTSEPLDSTNNESPQSTSDDPKNKTSNTKSDDFHNSTSFQDNLPNSTTEAPKSKAPAGYKTTESGLFVPEGTELPKEPAPHMSKMQQAEDAFTHTKGSFFKRLSVATAALIGGTVAANASETIGNVMNLADLPASTIVGQDFGIDNGVKPLNGQNITKEQINQAALKQGILNLSAPSQNNGFPTNLGSTPLSPAYNTIQAAQNDPGMAAAIDTYNTQQNVTALQTMRPNSAVTMQSRAGALQFMQNSKTGNLDIHMNGQGFADHTNLSFSQFQNVIDSPQMQYEMAQMFAQSDLTSQNAGPVLQAQDMEQFKQEMNANHQQAQMFSYRTASGINQTVAMNEEIYDHVTTEQEDRFTSIEEMIAETKDHIDDII